MNNRFEKNQRKSSDKHLDQNGQGFGDAITWKGKLTSPQFSLFLLVGKHTSLEDSGSDFHDLPAPELPKVIFSTWKGWEVGLGVRNSTGKCMIYIYYINYILYILGKYTGCNNLLSDIRNNPIPAISNTTRKEIRELPQLLALPATTSHEEDLSSRFTVIFPIAQTADKLSLLSLSLVCSFFFRCHCSSAAQCSCQMALPPLPNLRFCLGAIMLGCMMPWWHCPGLHLVLLGAVEGFPH